MTTENITNEQLAMCIKENNSKELKWLLWERVKPLLYKMAYLEYKYKREKFKKCGLELSDLKQSCIQVFLKALHGYNIDKGFKFISYLYYPMITTICDLLGTRTGVNKKPLDNCIGFEIKLPRAEIEYEDIDRQIQWSQAEEVLGCAIQKLSDKNGVVIKLLFYQELSIKQCSEIIGITTEGVRRRKNTAMKLLRKDEDVIRLGIDLGYL